MKLLYVSLFVYLSISVSHAQEAGYKGDMIMFKQIEKHLTKLDSLLFKKETTINPTNLPQINYIELNSDNIIEDLIEKHKMAYNSRTGLSLQAQYNSQKGVELVDYSDEENIYPYRNKFQVSLNWNIMESSLIGRKLSHKIIETEGQQNLYTINKNRQILNRERATVKATEDWNNMITFIYKQRLSLLNEVLRLKMHLFSSRRVLYSDVATIQAAIYEVKATLPTQDTVVGAENIQLIDLDRYRSNLKTDTLGYFNIYMSNNVDLEQYPIEQHLFALNKQSLSYIKQMKIGVFTKFQYFGGVIGTQYSGKVDFGVTATLPLSREHKRKQNAINKEIELSKREELYAEQSVISQYRSQMKRVTFLNNRLTQETLSLEPIALNIESYKEQYQNSQLSIENLLFEYDAYLFVLSNIYFIIKEREILLERLIN